jgi:hypothetical protein
MLKLDRGPADAGLSRGCRPYLEPDFACAAAARAGLTERLVREAPQLNGFFGYVNRLTREALPQTPYGRQHRAHFP